MAHWVAKVLVPVGPVEGDSQLSLEERRPGYTGQNVGIQIGGQFCSPHVFGDHLVFHVKSAGGGVIRDFIQGLVIQPGRDLRFEHYFGVFIGSEFLLVE
ncbi:hypothetical protein SDC9_186893 [bioreactor metagenome]|uniref:Uncharacterized protein n=1 Tax=bioreactor metagenome TaxID=1076179 RepID=A0A645HK27_9ZZZZ